MREIKFRAWNENSEYMGNPFDLYEELTLDHMANNTGIWLKDTIFMQYTGLKDKNGVEIYEGDIVQEDGWHNIVVEYGLQKVDAFVGMGFNLWSFYDSDENGYNANSKRLCNSIEVIGNIYENKELLNDNL